MREFAFKVRELGLCVLEKKFAKKGSPLKIVRQKKELRTKKVFNA